MSSPYFYHLKNSIFIFVPINTSYIHIHINTVLEWSMVTLKKDVIHTYIHTYIAVPNYCID